MKELIPEIEERLMGKTFELREGGTVTLLSVVSRFQGKQIIKDNLCLYTEYDPKDGFGPAHVTMTITEFFAMVVFDERLEKIIYLYPEYFI